MFSKRKLLLFLTHTWILAATYASELPQQFYEVPLYFEENSGQVDSDVKYLSRGPGYTFYFTPQEIVMALQNCKEEKSALLKIKFLGTCQEPVLKGVDEQECKSHYFIGNDSSKWLTSISNYGKVIYEKIYPGVDAIFYGNKQHLEYDLCVTPGGNPQDIRFCIEGAENIAIDSVGHLSVYLANREIVQIQKPMVYQWIDGEKKWVDAQFVLFGQNEIGFHLSSYNVKETLIIDPVLVYSSFLGGDGNDQGFSISVDNYGHVYVTGTTNSANFPLKHSIRNTISMHARDAFITKFNSAGTGILYSTYLGGSVHVGDASNVSQGNGVAVDNYGNTYVVGQTSSITFPTQNGYQRTLTQKGAPTSTTINAFLTVLDRGGGRLVYSTYFGGTGTDVGLGIAADYSHHAYIVGKTTSTDFPITSEAFQKHYPEGESCAFVAKFDTEKSDEFSLLYSTFLGGDGENQGSAIAIDTDRHAYVTGYTTATNFPTTSGALQENFGEGTSRAFVTKLNSKGAILIYSTYLGGNRDDRGEGIAIDIYGRSYITGRTSSTTFPVTEKAFQKNFGGGTSNAFVTKLNSKGASLVYSTYLGGNQEDKGTSIAVDAAGYAYLTGFTNSSNFPVTTHSYQSTLGKGHLDAFITKLNRDGSRLLFSTYFGGSQETKGFGIAVDSLANAYITGMTSSHDLPITPGAFQPAYGGGNHDAFVAKFAIGTPIIIELDPASGPESGETEVTIIGSNFTDATAIHFGKIQSKNFTIIDDSLIIAHLPEGQGIVDVSVTTNFGTSEISFIDRFTYRPPAPIHLKVTQKNQTNVLNWKAPRTQKSEIVSYKIYRNSLQNKPIGEVPSKKPLTFVDRSIKKGKRYTYYVVSINELGISSKPIEVATTEMEN